MHLEYMENLGWVTSNLPASVGAALTSSPGGGVSVEARFIFACGNSNQFRCMGGGQVVPRCRRRLGILAIGSGIRYSPRFNRPHGRSKTGESAPDPVDAVGGAVWAVIGGAISCSAR